jgi:RecA/RadA recombinase
MKKITLKGKREARNRQIARAPKSKSTDPMERLIHSINTRLGGLGRVRTGDMIEETQFKRRSSGIPSLDYITNGGFPRGGLVEIGGEFSVGKTAVSLEACATEQRSEGGNIGWVALEPFSKKWARERGFWLPFSEREVINVSTGEMHPIDPFDKASAIEKIRMEQLSITDPYSEVGGKFVLVQEERGDVALNVALDMLRSNMFAIIVVDSLGVAKSTKWLEEQDVEDAGDFPREAKMIGDYTTRAVLSLNWRYDENNVKATDGERTNQTTLIHLNHIGTVIGTQAHAFYKTVRIKGGKANEHNHHAIIMLGKGEQLRAEIGHGENTRPYVYAQEVKAICLKSKIGPAFMESSFFFYLQDYGAFRMGDFDVISDLVQLGLLAGVIEQAGAWMTYGDLKTQGREAFVSAVREAEGIAGEIWYAALEVLKR